MGQGENHGGSPPLFFGLPAAAYFPPAAPFRRCIEIPAPPAYNPWCAARFRFTGKRPGQPVMIVYSLRPRVSDLVFHLYGRPLHPELFDILAVRKIQRENYELAVRITRTGHVLTWENADVLLTEVATAADQPLPGSRRLLDYRLRGEHSGTLPCA